MAARAYSDRITSLSTLKVKQNRNIKSLKGQINVNSQGEQLLQPIYQDNTYNPCGPSHLTYHEFDVDDDTNWTRRPSISDNINLNVNQSEKFNAKSSILKFNVSHLDQEERIRQQKLSKKNSLPDNLTFPQRWSKSFSKAGASLFHFQTSESRTLGQIQEDPNLSRMTSRRKSSIFMTNYMKLKEVQKMKKLKKTREKFYSRYKSGGSSSSDINYPAEKYESDKQKDDSGTYKAEILQQELNQEFEKPEVQRKYKQTILYIILVILFFSFILCLPSVMCKLFHTHIGCPCENGTKIMDKHMANCTVGQLEPNCDSCNVGYHLVNTACVLDP